MGDAAETCRQIGEKMPAYRVYALNRSGKIASAEWIEAADDEAATTLARALFKPPPSWLEVWRGATRIAVVDSGRERPDLGAEPPKPDPEA